MKLKKDVEHFYVLRDRDGLFYGYSPDWDDNWGPLGVYTQVWSSTGQLSQFLTRGVEMNYGDSAKGVAGDLGALGEVIDRGGKVVMVKLVEDGEIPLSELKAFKNFENAIVEKRIDDI